MAKKVLTLCLVHQHPKILLGMKKRGFGAGRWNGFGGKVQPGESIEEATKREIVEEAGITVGAIEKVGVLNFEFAGEGGSGAGGDVLETHIFRAREFSGEPKESEEMKPQWFDARALPFEHMWPDDRHWMPLFLAGKKFTGRFLFGKGDAVLEKDLKEVEML